MGLKSHFQNAITSTYTTNRVQVRKVSYNESCVICNLDHPKLLIASHIVPWSNNEHERLNPHNGLCLCSIHDKAFDVGLISIDTNFKLLISKELQTINEHTFQTFFAHYEKKDLNMPKKFYPSIDFLNYHNEKIFLGI